MKIGKADLTDRFRVEEVNLRRGKNPRIDEPNVFGLSFKIFPIKGAAETFP